MSKGFQGLIVGALIAIAAPSMALAQGAPVQAPAQPTAQPAAQPWLPSLITATPEEGYALAIRLARRAVVATQPDAPTRGRLRPDYADDASGIIAAAHVVAVHFATVAAANNYWRR